jgi:hypothetical protein
MKLGLVSKKVVAVFSEKMVVAEMASIFWLSKNEAIEGVLEWPVDICLYVTVNV